jgi:colicin import membrane protein
VAQTRAGTVLSVEIGRCNGDQAVQQSIITAVQRADPLPQPPDPRLFERNLNLTFKPDQ